MASPVGYLLDTNVLLALIRGNNLGEVIDQSTLLTTDKDFDHLHDSKKINLIWIDPSGKP